MKVSLFPGAKRIPCEPCSGTGTAGPWNPSPDALRCQWCGGKKYVLVTPPPERRTA